MQAENEHTVIVPETSKARLAALGMTITGWAKVNGFNPQSVKHFFAGRWGFRAAEGTPSKSGRVRTSPRIYRQAKKDGIL